jgi:ribonucleases P/MRP protein subunit RPP40
LKIEASGINKKTVKWIEDWLKNRMQRVVINGKASEWILVISGVPQGSVLGPLLFVIFINDLDQAIQLSNSILYKFADDTKCGRVIENDDNIADLQKDLDNLLEWANTWQMQFNPDKCKVLHFGRNNPNAHYTMNGYAPAGTVLENVSEEKDVGVWISTSLKPSSNCQKAATRASSVLGQMSRAVTYRDRVTWIKLYKQYVRPHLEYCVQAWSPWLEQDKKVLEKVQERAVKMVSGLQGNTYEARLRELKLQSLEDRRKRGDMIQVWKILNKHDNLSWNDFFQRHEQNFQQTRAGADNLNLKKPRFWSEVRRNSFSIRVIDSWNLLPRNIKSAGTLNQFKNLYDRWIWSD